MTKIYLIGSLNNRKIIDLGIKIRELGYEVFDQWIVPGEEADLKFDEYRKKLGWTYKETLNSYAAKLIFNFDKEHLDRADLVILVMPAGKSGHIEAGYCVGRGKPTYILMDGEPERIDLMHNFVDKIFMTEVELLDELGKSHDNIKYICKEIT